MTRNRLIALCSCGMFMCIASSAMAVVSANVTLEDLAAADSSPACCAKAPPGTAHAAQDCCAKKAATPAAQCSHACRAAASCAAPAAHRGASCSAHNACAASCGQTAACPKGVQKVSTDDGCASACREACKTACREAMREACGDSCDEACIEKCAQACADKCAAACAAKCSNSGAQCCETSVKCASACNQPANCSAMVRTNCKPAHTCAVQSPSCRGAMSHCCSTPPASSCSVKAACRHECRGNAQSCVQTVCSNACGGQSAACRSTVACNHTCSH